MLALRAFSQRTVSSTFNRVSCVYFSNASKESSSSNEATNVLDKYVSYEEIRDKAQPVLFKAVGLPSNPDELDENSIFDYLEEQDPSVNDVVLKTIFAYGRAIGGEASFKLGQQYWQKYSESTIPSVHEYNAYLLLLGSANLSSEAWKVFVEMDRDCDRNASSYVNFLMFHPFASLKEEQKKLIQQSFDVDRQDKVTLENIDPEGEKVSFADVTKDMNADEKQAYSELFKDDWDYVKEEMFSGEFHKDWSPESSLKLIKESPFYNSLSKDQKEAYNEELDAFEFPNYS
jgi:hypothetical protein